MKSISRRNFLRTSGGIAAGTLIIPNFISCSANSTVNVAVVGVGGRGMDNWTSMIGVWKDKRRIRLGLDKDEPKQPYPHVRIVAMCDVDDRAAAKAYELIPQARKYKDFRVMMDEMHKDIDAVIVSTPDHTHFAATMAAMQMGKHVYVEKPLAHDIWQLRTLKKAADYYGVVTQLGNQGHASDGIRNIKEWYDQGMLGDIKEVHAWFSGPDFSSIYFKKPANYPPIQQTIPDGLDWELWQGPVKARGYSPEYLPRLWRSYYDLGTGMLGDWGCHTLDAPYWSLDLCSPDVVEPEQIERNSRMPSQFITDKSILRFEFPKRGNKPPVTLKWYDGGLKPENRPEWLRKQLPGSGMIMVGDKMSAMTGGKPWDAHLIMPNNEWKDFKENGWEKSIRRIPRESPHDEFIDAIRGYGPKPGSSFAYGADLTETVLLGAMAQRFNKRVEFDTANMKVTNHAELNNFIKEPARKGWQYGEELW
ncbi:Gfo/Idh/MocA family protein [Saccharicrinis sp. GN24d3]|uniref:Gfo/Idh/MocA family protein n=1 Tax=Saccharicrinis sp. GN24d3 TaxID=3458416 RepID=UPI0040371F37